MRIALIHENLKYRREFAQKYLGKAHVVLFDHRLDCEELIESARNAGGVDIAVVSGGEDNVSAFDYVSALRRAYKKSRIIVTESESGKSLSSFEAGFVGANLIESETYVLNHLEDIVVRR